MLNSVFEVLLIEKGQYSLWIASSWVWVALSQKWKLTKQGRQEHDETAVPLDKQRSCAIYGISPLAYMLPQTEEHQLLAACKFIHNCRTLVKCAHQLLVRHWYETVHGHHKKSTILWLRWWLSGSYIPAIKMQTMWCLTFLLNTAWQPDKNIPT